MAHDGSMEMVYLPTWMFDLYGKLVGKYTSPVGNDYCFHQTVSNLGVPEDVQ